MKQIKSAKGMVGFLLLPGVFREASTGKDYEILHPDITIIIEDEDAFIKEDTDGVLVIDVSNKTLGKDDSNT